MKDVVDLLKFLKKETEKYVAKNPYNLIEEADLQAFLYGRVSEYFDKKGKEEDAYFTDEGGDINGEGRPIQIYAIHCEYPRHIVEVTDNGKEELYCNRGRYDMAILRTPKDKENKFIDDTLIKYPVDVAFELKLIWHENDKSRIGTNTVVHKVGEDLWVFGWDEERGKFDPNPEDIKETRVYPEVGIVFQVHLVKKKGTKEELKDELWKIIKKRSEYNGNDLPDIFIVYIEIDRYNKEINKSFIIPEK